MSLTFIQKATSTGTTSLSFVLPSGGSTAKTLLVVTAESTDGNARFTPPSGWIPGPTIHQTGNVRAEQWYYPYNPGNLATSGSPAVFTTTTGATVGGCIEEFSSAPGTSQTLLAHGNAIASGGGSLTVTASTPPATSAVAAANFATNFSAAPGGTFTGPGGSWAVDQVRNTGTAPVGTWRLSPITGASFANIIGAAGNDPSIGCPSGIPGWTYANGIIGPLNGAKLFYGGNLPANISSGTPHPLGGGFPTDLPDGVIPLICYATPDTNLTSFVNSVTSPIILCWLNECEDKSQYTPAQFKTIFQRQATTIRAVGNPNVQIAQCSIGYQYHNGVNANAVAGNYIVDPAYVDMYVIDLYQHYVTGSGAPGTGYRWPSQGLANWDQWLNWIKVVGPTNKPLGIAEYGIDAQMTAPPTNDPTNAARSARISADASYLAAAFGPSGTVSSYPMAMWLYWYSNCSAGVLTTDLEHNYQFPSTETASVNNWKANQASTSTASATVTYSVTTGILAWAATIGVYGESGAPPAITITTSSLPNATIGSSYSQTFAASGTSPWSWIVTSGSLPPSMTLTTGGLLSGVTPGPGGQYAFSVQVTDNAGQTATADFILNVVPGQGGGGNPAGPAAGFPQIIAELGTYSASPVAPPGTLQLDDPIAGVLDGSRMGDGTQWNNITTFIKNGSVTRPSSREQGPLRTYEAATASATLDNVDGRFDPENLNSPLASGGVTNIRPMVPLRVRATYNNVEYHLFSGFADNWQETPLGFDAGWSEVTVSATDGFKVLGGITLPAVPDNSITAELSGSRINRILNLAQWYSDHRNIAAGDSEVQTTNLGDNALSLMQLTADSEAGEVYIDGSGNVVFRNRHDQFTATRSTIPQGIFGDKDKFTTLTAAQSGFEGGLGTWLASTNCAITSVSLPVRTGNGAMQMTSSAAGDMTAAHCSDATILTNGLPVSPGQPIPVSAWTMANTIARATSVGIKWYNASGTVIGTTVFGSSFTNVVGGWTQASALLTAPAGAAWCRGVVKVTGTGAAGEIHFVDDVSLGYGELPFAQISRSNDDTTLANDVQATIVGGNLQEVSSTASIRQYLFPRTYSRSDLILTSDAEALSWAQWILAVSLNGEERFDQITIDPLADPGNLFPQVLGREMGDLISIWRRPQNVPGLVVGKPCYIRGIHHEIDVVNGTWRTTWDLELASDHLGFLLLNDSSYGLLDTARLAF